MLWSMAPYCEEEIDDAVESWNEYLAAVSERLPRGSVQEEAPVLVPISQDSLNTCHAQRFASGFLLPAQQLPTALKTIAPGLHILHDTLLTRHGPLIGEHKQSPDTMEQNIEWATSLLLYPADEKLEAFSEQDEQDNTANPWRSAKLLGGRTRLYLTPSAYDSVYYDRVNLLTPWPMDVSNTRILGWDNCAYEPSHNLYLSRVLSKWKDLIISGVWAVGPNGVEGGIDAWKESASSCSDISNHVCLI